MLCTAQCRILLNLNSLTSPNSHSDRLFSTNRQLSDKVLIFTSSLVVQIKNILGLPRIVTLARDWFRSCSVEAWWVLMADTMYTLRSWMKFRGRWMVFYFYSDLALVLMRRSLMKERVCYSMSPCRQLDEESRMSCSKCLPLEIMRYFPKISLKMSMALLLYSSPSSPKLSKICLSSSALASTNISSPSSSGKVTTFLTMLQIFMLESNFTQAKEYLCSQYWVNAALFLWYRLLNTFSQYPIKSGLERVGGQANSLSRRLESCWFSSPSESSSTPKKASLMMLLQIDSNSPDTKGYLCFLSSESSS